MGKNRPFDLRAVFDVYPDFWLVCSGAGRVFSAEPPFLFCPPPFFPFLAIPSTPLNEKNVCENSVAKKQMFIQIRS